MASQNFNISKHFSRNGSIFVAGEYLYPPIHQVDSLIFSIVCVAFLQIEHWGSVEYAHGVELVDTRARVAAGTLMVHLVSESSNVKQKQNLNQQGIV